MKQGKKEQGINKPWKEGNETELKTRKKMMTKKSRRKAVCGEQS